MWCIRAKVNSQWDGFCDFLTRGWVLFGLTVVAAGVTIYVQWVHGNCQAAEKPYHPILDFVVTLSSGFVSAAIFYFIVNYCAFKKRQATLRFYVRNKMYRACELLRLCRESVRNQLNFDKGWTKELKKEEYINLFRTKDMCSDHSLFENMSLLDFLNNRRSELYHVASELLQHKEYLEDAEFRFIMRLAGSSFLMEGVIPYLTPEDDKAVCHCQECLGEEIYDLYEEGRKITSAYVE